MNEAQRGTDVELGETFEPDACAVCGRPKRSHAIAYHPTLREYGPWVEPSDELRKARMILRRISRPGKG